MGDERRRIVITDHDIEQAGNGQKHASSIDIQVHRTTEKPLIYREDIYKSDKAYRQYEEGRSSVDKLLEDNGVIHITCPVSEIPLRNIELLKDALRASLIEWIQQHANSFTPKDIETFINHIVNPIQRYILGTGPRGEAQRICWETPVQIDRLGVVKCTGIELFIRKGQHLIPDGVGIYGYVETDKIRGREVFTPTIDQLRAIHLFYFGRVDIVGALYEILGRNVQRSDYESLLKSSRGYDFTEYLAVPLTYTSEKNSTDIIYYPHPNEWDSNNTRMTDADYLRHSIDAKARVLYHYERVTGALVPIHSSVAVNTLETTEEFNRK